jgi:hypothetical protein
MRTIFIDLKKLRAFIWVDIYASEADHDNGKTPFHSFPIAFTQHGNQLVGELGGIMSESLSFGGAFTNLAGSGQTPMDSLLDKLFTYLGNNQYAGVAQVNPNE